MGAQITESKICDSCISASFLHNRILFQITGNESMGCILHAYNRQTAEIYLHCGNSSADPDYGRNVYTGAFLLPVSLGAVFAIMPVIPGALFKRNRQNCAPKCTLCKKRCPAHLDIDGDTAHSGECICCHACTAVCPRKNIHTGTVIDKK